MSISPSCYHFIGIGGIGMSALARILLQRGKQVHGSDAASTYIIDALKAAGAQITTQLAANPVVVYGSAIKKEHPEYREAVERGLLMLHRSELLAHLMEGTKSLLVTGTHGKTTTSSLLAHVLSSAGLDPSYAIGGVPLNFHSNGGHGSGEYFVAEADESDGTFLKYPSFAAIVTNIERDHMDHWKEEEALIGGFKAFAARTTSHLFWCKDDPKLEGFPGFSYGFSNEADLRILSWKQEGWMLHFTLAFEGKTYEGVRLPMIGRHNVSNAAAVFGLCLKLGLDEQVIRRSFASFLGVKRRMEKKKEVRGALIFDDYAHHPTEIKATLEAAKAAVGEKRLVVAFQPHRYSRTRDCWNEFLTAFEKADVLILTEIYAAGEKPQRGISAKALFKAVQCEHKHFVKREELGKFCSAFLKPHDVLITMGAGDITLLSEEISEISTLKVALLSGGQSTEHDVSHLSAKVILSALNPEYYTVKPFVISKDGEWFLSSKYLKLSQAVKELQECDIVLPMIHGPFCEDGMIQGFLETLGIPYTGPDYRSAPVAMDKAWTKRIALTHGVATAPFMEFYVDEWEKRRQECLERITARFAFPFFAKPVHLGSTFGVHRVKDLAALEQALDAIATLDTKFLIEEEVVGREMEFGFLGNFQVHTTDPAEVLSGSQIYTYEGKYGANPTVSVVKVELPPEVKAAGREAAQTVYRAIGCTGFARIDFFLKADNTWVLNEVNPIPGCTPTSVYPKLWPAEGISVGEMVDQLIISGLHRKRYQDKHL